VKVKFRGVRGSIPTPGAATAEFGGNSSCVEIRADDGPPLVLDCGTGARALGMDLIREGQRQVHVLFSHFHMDHLFGFPFFGPVYTPSCKVEVCVPAHNGEDAKVKLGNYLRGTYHPVRLADLPAQISYRGVRPGRPFDVGPYQIQAVALNHPGGSCGYRITVGQRTVVYLTDTAPLARPGTGLVDGRPPPGPERRVLSAMKDADLVIMDTMFTFEEYLEKMSWGHAYPEYGVALAEAAGAGRLALFHHSPDASDTALTAQARHWAAHESDVDISVARENEVIDLGRD
jgi:phosphoribosyl 1,2-cyclic phosphodiesterase